MIIAAVLGYLFGSIPTAVLAGRRLGVDPRYAGNGNPGWLNMRQLTGDRAAWIVLALDMIKGAVPVLIVANLWGPWWWGYVAAFFAMLGHAFPAFAGLRGGKSVLTFMGAMIVLAPYSVLAAIAAGLIVAAVFRNFTRGALVMVLGVPLIQLASQPIEHVVATGVLMTLSGLRFLVSRPGSLATTARS